MSEAVKLPSQYMRRILATELDVEQWDWRAFEEEEPRLLNTYMKLIEALTYTG